jgi:hypothetical protein
MTWIGRRFVPQSTIDRRVQAKDDRINRATQAAHPLIPPALRSTLTPRELSTCVTLLGKGWTVQRAIDHIQAERPTLPFPDPQEAA